MEILERVKSLKKDECIVDTLVKEIPKHNCLSCGKCVYGYEGATQLSLIFKSMSEKKSSGNDLELISFLTGKMKTQSLCEDGVNLANSIEFVMNEYSDSIKAHHSKKDCPAGVCAKFVTYHILPDLCIGCGECLDECDDDAIIGKKKFIHIIDQDECIQCGNCLDACDEDAIVKAGAIKPRCPKKPMPCKAK